MTKENPLTKSPSFPLYQRGRSGGFPVSPPGVPCGAPEGKDERERWSWGNGICLSPLPSRERVHF